jgi:hypothetical protein
VVCFSFAAKPGFRVKGLFYKPLEKQVVLANPEVSRVSGFKGLFYKPLEKQVVLTNPEVTGFRVCTYKP